MKFKGKFHGVSRDVDGHLIVSFRSYEEKCLEQIDAIKDIGTLVVSALKPNVKRSLSANAMYWVLVGRLAAYMHVSNNRMHNLLLRRYGTVDTFDGERLVVFVPDTDDAENDVLEQEKFHLKPTSATKTFKDGKARRMYIVIKGSSEYDTKEMSRLIHGTIDDCNQCGIPTATPREIAEALARHGKKHNSER